jgi:hypothetical protein
MSGQVATDGEEERPVLPWRLVVGVLLHFVIPAYLATIVIAGLLGAPRHASTEALLAFLLDATGAFVGAYVLLIVGAAGAARLLDPPLRRRRAAREAADPRIAANRSQRRVVQALSQAGRLAVGAEAGRVTAAIAAIRESGWHHGDDRFQAMSADLAEATRAFVAAFDTAEPVRRAEIAGLAATALERIAAALAALSAERRRLDEGDARTAARYIDARYGGSDFSSDFSGRVD